MLVRAFWLASEANLASSANWSRATSVSVEATVGSVDVASLKYDVSSGVGNALTRLLARRQIVAGPLIRIVLD